jgi:dTDP-glucose 4,6-dehydratase
MSRSPALHPIAPLPIADLEHILQHTTDLWQELAGARFFITGGTGFFGLWLLETLAFANQRLGLDLKATILTRDSRAFAQKAPHLASNPMFDWHEGNVRTFAFPQGKFSHIIHAAATSSNPIQLQEMLDTLVDGTRRVLDFAAQSHCKRLLLISSGAVYGTQPPELPQIPEEHPHGPDPVNPAYGEGKRTAERLCSIFAQQQNIPCVIARCFAFIGPYLPLDAHYAAGNFLRDALKGNAICINSDGRSMRSYLYMADLVIWLLTILLRGKSAHPYNVGSDEAISIADLALCIKEILGVKSAIQIRDKAAPTPPPRYVPAIHRAKKELDLQVKIDLNNAISRTVAWLGKKGPDKNER